MQLPGGIPTPTGLERGFGFKPVDGRLELALNECAGDTLPLAQRVTRALACTLSDLAGEAPETERVHDLCVGDRQFLMRQLGVHLGLDTVWLTGDCIACEKPFDTCIEQSKLPVKVAGKGYPFARVRIGGRRIQVRVPTGVDQEAIADIDDEREAVRALASRLVPARHSTALDDDVVAQLETAVEAVAPEVALEVQTSCPHCEHENRVSVDPYLCLELGGGALFEDIHTLAARYHWSEADILGLPKARRHVYLRLLDRERGLTSAGAPP